MFLYFIVGLLFFAFSVYSYSLIDPNITFFQNQAWTSFRNTMVQFGYYQREFSWYVYLALVLSSFVMLWIALNKYKKLDPVKLAIIVGVVTIFSYPFLSHDFFNYMFDAKIFTFYHQNPYLHKALDFPSDQWLRFMHWTHRPYPYGPTFLPISFIPSFLGFGKFSLTFLLFKAMNCLFYLISVWLLKQLNKKWAIFFVLNPLVIIEGLINGHNDMVGLGLAIIGIYFVLKKRNMTGRVVMLIASAIKYINAPVILLGKNKALNVSALIIQIALLGYLSFGSEIQPWYFLALFAFLPFFSEMVYDIQIFLFGLLVSYYPYIRLGGWDTAPKISLKHEIILVFLGLNILYLLFRSRMKFFTR